MNTHAPSTANAGVRHGRGVPLGQLLLILGAIVVIAAVGVGVDSPFFLSLAAYTCSFALFALSVNIILGGIGEVPLGHCVFFGVGAYVPAVLMHHWDVAFELGILAGMVVATVVAVVIGTITLRLTGAHFSIVSWGLSGVAYVIVHNLEVTGGALGLFGFQRLSIAGVDLTDPRSYFICSALILLLVLIFLAHVRSSRFGDALDSVRQSPHLAQSLGINVYREKLKAVVLSAPIAALAGAMCIPYAQIVTPEVMSVVRTVDAMLAVLIGGTALLFGPIIGAVIFTIIPQFFEMDANVKVLVFSIMIIVVMMVAPGGLHQLFKSLAQRIGLRDGGR